MERPCIGTHVQDASQTGMVMCCFNYVGMQATWRGCDTNVYAHRALGCLLALVVDLNLCWLWPCRAGQRPFVLAECGLVVSFLACFYGMSGGD